MKLDRLAGFEVDRFLDQYWQRQPCLIHGWLEPNSQSLADMLALADHHDLPSRLVSGRQDSANWTLTHGPLELDDLPDSDRDWTVLVQEMDKVCPDVAEILEQFRFLPDWMIDDVMISQAADGGSVGAHVDAYDVFLVQAEGQRCWQLATRYDQRLDERFEMALLTNWKAEIEVLVSPGDVLYLPAGIAHHGIARGPCQTWSVGLRTPSGPEMLFYLAEFLVGNDSRAPRLQPARPDRTQPAAIDPNTLARARGLIADCLSLDDQALAEMMARMLTSWRLWHGAPGLDDRDQAMRHLAAGHQLALASNARLAVLNQGKNRRLFINGESIECPPELAEELATSRTLRPAWHEHPDAVDQLIELGAIASLPRPRIVASR
jgi:50S ribosomal protein L16 3-hydroxylase